MRRPRFDTAFWDGFLASAERGICIAAGFGAAYLIVRIGLEFLL